MELLGWAVPGDPDYLEDGVYLDLPAEQYFRQGLGSSDLMDLWRHKEGWWWKSPWNRRRKRVTTKEQIYGSALHAIVLEGVGAYEKRFVCEPDWATMPDLFDTAEDAKRWLAANGFRTTGQPYSGYRKEDWIEACVDGEIDIPWKSVIERRLSDDTRTRISASDDADLRFMREVMLDPDRDDNEEIRSIFGDNSFPALVEVSIFHTLPNGVRRRWRLDRMFPAFDLDLKSLGDWKGRPLKFAVGDIITNRGYDIQRADYKRGRQIAYAYIKAGRLFGGSLDQKAWLMEWPELFPTWDWKWLFFQKPDSKLGHAPVLFPLHDDDGGQRELTGAAKADVAYNRFLTYRAKYGLEKPWARVEPLHYTDERHDPERTVIFPHYIDDIDEPTEAEAYPGDEDQ